LRLIILLSTKPTLLNTTKGKLDTWADILNRAGLGMEVMHERNAHNFPLDLAAAESAPVALTAPSIG
jgi:photosystem II P680 reaction center D1 protein